jgi:hypothetical protein
VTATPLSALQALPLAQAIRASVWAFPLLEIVHIAALAAMVGSVLMVELRVFGLARALPLPALGRLGAAVGVTAFVVIVASGSLLFLSDAAGYAGNRAFVVKLVLITAAAANMVAFHARGSLERADRVAKLQAAASLLLWLAVIAAGRLIAYV